MRYLTLLAALTATLSALGAEFSWSFGSQGPSGWFGYNQAETYDVAVLLDEQALKGARVEGICVSVPKELDITDASVWLSSSLDLKRVNGRYVHQPDLAQAEASVKDGMLTMTFAAPYTITGPIYAGYSFTASGENEIRPVAITEDASATSGLNIHSSRSNPKWKECATSAGGYSSLKVMISASLTANAAAFTCLPEYAVSAEEETTLTVPLVNHGSSPVYSVEYKWKVAEKEGSHTYNFTDPLPAEWGAQADVPLCLGQLPTLGLQTLQLEVTAVNSSANLDIAPSCTSTLMVYPFIPENRPLVEEYTGLWCGYCTSGYVALENLRDWYPDNFIGLAYHCDDAMEGSFLRPTTPDGYPSAYINRGGKVRPAELYDIWPSYTNAIPPADIKLNIQWADEAHSSIEATSEVRFIKDMDKAAYAIGYALLADNLSHPSWVQVNAYSGRTNDPDMPGELGEKFTNGPANMKDLIFNDVVVLLPQKDGFPSSIPQTLSANETIKHSATFHIDDIGKDTDDKSALKNAVLSNLDKLHAVAFIIDKKTGKVVNSVSTPHIDGTPLSSLPMTQTASSPVVKTEFYNLSGYRVSSDTCGLLIKVQYHADGSRRVTKTVSNKEL